MNEPDKTPDETSREKAPQVNLTLGRPGGLSDEQIDAFADDFFAALTKNHKPSNTTDASQSEQK
jgi:hypothetical protein